MSIADLMTKFRSRLTTYSPVVNLLEDPSGNPMNQRGAEGAALVTTMLPGVSDLRVARFTAASGMPAFSTTYSTWLTNVAADRISLTGYTLTARRIKADWISSGHAGADTQATQAFFGEVAVGAAITINAPDDATANARLASIMFDNAGTPNVLTGAGSSSAGAADTFIIGRGVSADIIVTEAIARIDLIGIPNGLGSTNLDIFLPALASIAVIG